MRRLLSLVTILLPALLSFAQSITGNAPRNIVMGESFRVIYEIAATDIDEFLLEDLPEGIEEVMPPFGATATEGGKSITRYTAILSAEREGSFTLPAPKALINGKEVLGKPLTISVGSTSPLPAPAYKPTVQSEQQITDDKSLQNVKEEFFARTVVGKRQVMQNEPVIVSVYIYSKGSIEGLNGNLPELSDFYIQEMTKEGEVESTKEAIRGQEYDKILWAKYIMYPQHSGTLTIPSITFRGRVKTENKNISSFDAVLMNPADRFKVVNTTITSPAVQLNVEALPEPPAGFSGAVGKFSMRVKFADQSVGIDEPAVIKIAIRGNGNIKLLKAPSIQFPKSFTVHDVQTTDSMQLSNKYGADGEVVYTYTATANSPGEFKMQPIQFIYFDTDSNKYITIQRTLQSITVGSAKNGASPSLAPIKQLDDVSPARSLDFMLSKRYFALLALQLVLFALAWWLTIKYRKIQDRKAAEEEKLRKEKETEYERRMIAEIRSRFENQQKTPLILILLFVSSSLFALNINVERANDAYTIGDYQKAIKLYREELKSNPSADIYYNLGNAYYEMREIDKAVQSYERAYVLNANDPDIQNNLALAKSKQKNRQLEQPENFIVSAYRYVVYLFPADIWATLSLLFFMLLLISIHAYHFSRSGTRSRNAFYCGMAAVVLFLLSAILAIQQQWFINQ